MSSFGGKVDNQLDFGNTLSGLCFIIVLARCEWNFPDLRWRVVILLGPDCNDHGTDPMPGRAHENGQQKGKRVPGEYSVEEVALFNLTLFADYVWSESSLDIHREACQKTWVKFNRIREACQKTSVLDLLAEIRIDQRKTVRDTIPFSHLAQYGNYEYNEATEKGFLAEAEGTPLSFEGSVFSAPENVGQQHWKHNVALTSLTSESIIQNQLVREAHEKVEGIDYAQQLEYTASFQLDPSLGRGEDPPIGNFGRLCGPFDPIKFNGLVKEILKGDSPPPRCGGLDDHRSDLHTTFSWRNNCITWTNWLLCVYPEFLQSLCSRDDFAQMMSPDIEMSIDYLEILDKPVSAFDIHQFPKPKLRSWNRCRQGVRRLFQQITSQEVQRLWLCDDLILDNRARLGLSASEEEVARPQESASGNGKTGRERMRRTDRPTWMKKNPHLSGMHRREEMRNTVKRNAANSHVETDKNKERDRIDHNVVASLKTTGTTRTPSAPMLTELNFEDFPTLSEAATMNFRQPAVSAPQQSRPRQQGDRQKKAAPYDCRVEWGIFVGTPLQRNIHSKSDTDLHRSASQGSNSHSSPLSDSSLGLRSESDSDLQLQESFRRREHEAHGLLRSITSGRSTSSDESCISPRLQMTDDGQMNIHAPSFRPRGPPSHSRQLVTLASSVSLLPVTNGHLSKNHQRPQHTRPESRQQPTASHSGSSRQLNWQSQQQQQRPQIPQTLAEHTQSSSTTVYGPRRTSLSFPQPPSHWRQPFPVLCKPPPGFETLCVLDGHQVNPSAPPPTTSQSLPPPSQNPPIIPPHPAMVSTSQFIAPSAPQAHPGQFSGTQSVSGNVPAALAAGRQGISFFPQAYSNQYDMFPYHTTSHPLFHQEGGHRVGSSQSSPRQAPSTPTSVPSSSTTSLGPQASQTDQTKGTVPVTDSSSYLMSVPQFACPVGFPNQIFPNCRYLVPPPVRMPNPQQFLPSTIMAPHHQAGFPSSTTELPFGWARLPQAPVPGSSGFQVPPIGQSPFIHSYGGLFGQFPAIPGFGGCCSSAGLSFSTPEGVQQQLHPLTWFPPQSRYKTFMQHMGPGTGNLFTQEAVPLTSREDGRDFTTTFVPRSAPLWRTHRPSESVTGNASTYPIDSIANVSSGSEDGRKPRPRKRDPSNLVHLVGSELSHARRERNRRPTRCRMARGILQGHEASLLCNNRETPSEDSEHSATQNDESSEEWALDPLAAESEEFSDVAETLTLSDLASAMDSARAECVSSVPPKTRQRSLNTSESSRSSEPELLEDLGSPEKSNELGRSMPRYRSYKECLQMSVSGGESDVQSKSDLEKLSAREGLDGCQSSLGSIHVPRLVLPMSMGQGGSSASFPSSPEKDGRPASGLEETFCGQATSPSSPSACSPPQLMTPPRSYVATPTLLCSPHTCEPEALESALLQHLAKWSAAKMATEAEGLDSSEAQSSFGFRWIPEDDLERQAAEEYCPSKENSHEKLAHGPVHSPLHRSASRGATDDTSKPTSTYDESCKSGDKSFNGRGVTTGGATGGGGGGGNVVPNTTTIITSTTTTTTTTSGKGCESTVVIVTSPTLLSEVWDLSRGVDESEASNHEDSATRIEDPSAANRSKMEHPNFLGSRPCGFDDRLHQPAIEVVVASGDGPECPVKKLFTEPHRPSRKKGRNGGKARRGCVKDLRDPTEVILPESILFAAKTTAVRCWSGEGDHANAMSRRKTETEVGESKPALISKSRTTGTNHNVNSIAPNCLSEHQMTEKTLKRLSAIAEGVLPTNKKTISKRMRVSAFIKGNACWSPKICSATNIMIDPENRDLIWFDSIAPNCPSSDPVSIHCKNNTAWIIQSSKHGGHSSQTSTNSKQDLQVNNEVSYQQFPIVDPNWGLHHSSGATTSRQGSPADLADGDSPRTAHQRVMMAFINSATGFVKRLVFNAF